MRSASAIAACVGLLSLVVASHGAQKLASLGDSADDATTWSWSPLATPAVSGDSLLGVKFYVYEDFAIPSRLTLDGKPLPDRLETLDPERPMHTVNPSVVKHLDDLLLARQAVRHPMRTDNASEAALFYVPTPLNAVSMFGQRLCHHKAVLRNAKLFDYSTKVPFELYMYHFALLIYPNLEPRPQSFAPSDAFSTARMTDINATAAAAVGAQRRR